MKVFWRVPTTAETVMNVRSFVLTVTDPPTVMQPIVVVVAHDVDPQTALLSTPMTEVGVASSNAKLNPCNVVIAPPETAWLNVASADTTGASKLNAFLRVPTIALIVT